MKKYPRLQILGLAVGSAILLTSCAFFSSKEVDAAKASNQVTREYFYQMIFNQEGLAFETENFLRGNLMLDNFDENPLLTLKKIENYYQISQDPKYLDIAADLCRWIAVRVEPDLAIRYHLSACYYCRAAAQQSMRKDDPNAKQLNQMNLSYRQLLIYNEACYGVFSYLHQRGLLDHDSFDLIDIEGRKYTFTPAEYRLALPREMFTDFLPCPDYQIEDLFQKNMRNGIGLPLIGVVAQKPIYKSLRTPASLTVPVTMLQFIKEKPDHSFEIKMLFLDTSVQESLRWGNEIIAESDWPLALDFSTPLAYFLGHLPEKNLISLMLNADDAESSCGLYMLEPYQPNKIPVVLVHGLMSSPNTWSQMINSLRNDETIRKHYQFWFYFYSSGMPIPVSSKKLLTALYDAQKEFCTTEEATKNFNQMVIVGHSMGGLITRMLVSNHEHAFVEARFKAPWEKISANLLPTNANEFSDLLSYPPLPFVHRVIFMAVPHRGSEMAQWGIARFGSRITSLPKAMFSRAQTLLAELKSQKEFSSLSLKKYTGLENLDPDSDFIQALAQVPIKNSVTYHSIIGDQNSDNRLGGSDGVVPYWSSHLDGAASEMIVQSGHSVHRVPAAIREVMRILRLHLPQEK